MCVCVVCGCVWVSVWVGVGGGGGVGGGVGWVGVCVWGGIKGLAAQRCQHVPAACNSSELHPIASAGTPLQRHPAASPPFCCTVPRPAVS